MCLVGLVSLLIQKIYNIRRKYLISLERRRGIDIHVPEIIEDVHQDLMRNFPYSPSRKRSLQRVVKRLPITSNDAILDVGCGKGGAFVTFSKYPFWKLGGGSSCHRNSLRLLKTT